MSANPQRFESVPRPMDTAEVCETLKRALIGCTARS
jgi:hypothetical protein